MTLVRVYCGLTTAGPRGRPGADGSPLVAAMVDDAGRTLDVCEIDDHPRGYARLTSLLTERASGPYSVAIACDNGEWSVPQLLATARWAIAFTDQSTADEYAQRFAGDLTATGGTPLGHRALGLARALHAGALVATTVAPPAGLADLKPMLAADSALATGRYSAATALREILRELYPAALRAYPDPAAPLALAVIDALPEPGALSTGGEAWALDTVAASLADRGIGDRSAVHEAITALRVAVAETSRRPSVHQDLAGAVGSAVRQAVAAVRACDAARHALVDPLAQWMAGRPAQPAQPATRTRAGAWETAAGSGWEVPAHTGSQAASSGAAWDGRTGARATVPSDGGRRAAPHAAGNRRVPTRAVPAGAGARSFAAGPASAPPVPGRPVSSPPPPPGISPISGTGTAAVPGAGTAAVSGTGAAAVSGTGAAPPLPMRPRRPQGDPGRGQPEGADIRVPTPRPAPEGPPRGARESWPTSPPPDDWASAPAPAAPVFRTPDQPPLGRTPAAPAPARPVSAKPASAKPVSAMPVSAKPVSAKPASARPASVTPPWLADDLRPPEPPSLRLVEPTLPEELRQEFGGPAPSGPPLRLVGPPGIPQSVPPVDAGDDDCDLLIFAQARSAWFSGERESGPWASPMDDGWRAAEQAAHPAVDEVTGSGLPRRVPHANLVPGAPPRDSDRPLRVVRDPSSIAAHTSGYFNGWRRGQEVGGYPLGNRVGQNAAGAWEFARDDRLSG